MPRADTYGTAKDIHYDARLDEGRPQSKPLGEMTSEDLEAWFKYQQVRRIIEALGY